jgi:Secretion system C-terminal sorting domain
MKLNLFFVLIVNVMIGQPNNNLFTLVTKLNQNNTPTTAQNKPGVLNPVDGIVSDVGISFTNKSFSVTGGAFDSNSLKMLLITENSSLTSFDFNSGSVTSIPITTSYTGNAYFDNVSYSTSDQTLYGLIRPFNVNNASLGIFLAKLNTTTGNITTISQNSLASSYQLAGVGIDPQLMVYYFKTGPKFLGIDLYNGSIFSQPNVTFISNDYDFSNFTYNCADNTIYGIAREMTNLQMPNTPPGVMIQHSRLAKIDPTTGIVTRISDTILPNYYYSLNAASTIDPSNNVFYYSDNSFIYGVSLTTGEVVTNTAMTFENGNFVNFLSNINECMGAIPSRLNPNLANTIVEPKNYLEVYPNPTSSNLKIKSDYKIDSVSVFDSLGRIVLAEKSTDTLDVSNLQNGTYFIKIVSGNLSQNRKFIKTNLN